MRFWKRRTEPERWELRTRLQDYTHRLFARRGSSEVFISDLHNSAHNAGKNMEIIERAMLLVDILNTRAMTETDVEDSLARLLGDTNRKDDHA